jgi:chromosome segregation ATPase
VKAADIERTQRETDYDLLRRELAVLRGEVGVERGLQALKAEIAAAKSEIPRLPEIEARVDAKQSKLEAEQARLERELAKTKDRLATLRARHSETQYGLAQLERQAKQRAPEIEIKLETTSSQFVMRDIDPDAMEAWRRFAAGMLEAQQDAETTLSITRATGAAGQVVALPVRRNGNAA